MSHSTPIVKVEVRERLGKKYARRLRNSGRLPATIYSKGTQPVSVSVDQREIIAQLKAGSHVIELDNGDGTPATVLIKDLQYGFLGDNIIHVDFARVNLKQIVTVTMTLDIVGKPTAASAPGAVLEVPRPQIEIECMVQDIPDSIKVDLTTVEEIFTIGDLILPDNVKALLEPERHIAHVTMVLEEAEEVSDSDLTADGEDATTPEVISEATTEEASSDSPKSGNSE